MSINNSALPDSFISCFFQLILLGIEYVSWWLGTQIILFRGEKVLRKIKILKHVIWLNEMQDILFNIMKILIKTENLFTSSTNVNCPLYRLQPFSTWMLFFPQILPPQQQTLVIRSMFLHMNCIKMIKSSQPVAPHAFSLKETPK